MTASCVAPRRLYIVVFMTSKWVLSAFLLGLMSVLNPYPPFPVFFPALYWRMLNPRKSNPAFCSSVLRPTVCPLLV